MSPSTAPSASHSSTTCSSSSDTTLSPPRELTHDRTGMAPASHVFTMSDYSRTMYAHTKRQMDAATRMARRRHGDGHGGRADKASKQAAGVNTLATMDSIDSAEGSGDASGDGSS